MISLPKLAHKALNEVKPFLHFHFVGEIFLSVFYFVCVSTPFICERVFDHCNIDVKEYEMLVFLACVIGIKGRRQPTVKHYLRMVFLFSKLLNLTSLVRANISAAIFYVVLLVLQMVFFPEPSYKGPDKLTYLRANALDDEFKRDSRNAWLVCFYTAWSPPCMSFASEFAELSELYGLSNFRFGKVDVSAYPLVAKKYQINTSTWSKELPTLVLFENGGVQKIRRPLVDPKGRVLPYVWTKDTIIRDFDLQEIHDRYDDLLSKRKSQSSRRAPAEELADENGEITAVEKEKNEVAEEVGPKDETAKKDD